jgi:dTDP-4-amino-4,6-dideoxygalactose transaminase
LAEEGIETGVYYPRPVHEYDCFRSHPQVKVTGAGALKAARAADEVLSLPVHQWLQPGDLDRIASTVAALLG